MIKKLTSVALSTVVVGGVSVHYASQTQVSKLEKRMTKIERTTDWYNERITAMEDEVMVSQAGDIAFLQRYVDCLRIIVNNLNGYPTNDDRDSCGYIQRDTKHSGG